MKIYIAKTNLDDGWTEISHVEMIAMHALSTSGKHTLVDDPESAELILLTGNMETLEQARSNVFLRKYPEKTMVYSEIDTVVPYGPGVYGSAYKPKLIDLKRMRSFVYLSGFQSCRNEEIRHRPDEPKDLLFCFRGKRDCRVRARILEYPYNRPDVLVMDTSAYSHWSEGQMDKAQARRDYADTLARSHFALAPRGAGFGSIRLFEVMQMGVAPVLLADKYVLPVGPDWDSFLLRVPEADYGRLPELLEPHVHESAERGRLARAAWEQYFAPELAFDLLVEQLEEMRRERVIPERLYQRMWPLVLARHEGRARLSASVRKSAALVRRMLGVKTPPKGWVPSDSE